MSLPLLISLFLAALVGVFPATAPALAAPAPATVAYTVERPAPVDASLTDRGADVASAVADPLRSDADTEPGRHPVVRVLIALDVHAAAAPRAPPLLHV